MHSFRILILINLLFSIAQSNQQITNNQINNQTLNHNNLFATKTTYHQAYFKLLQNDNQIRDFKIPAQCRQKMFYLVCRHATRYPSKKKITRMQDQLYLFKDKIIAANNLDLDLIEKFKNWKLRIQLDDDNRISDTGFQETRELGKKIYSKNIILTLILITKSNLTFSLLSS